VKRKKRFEPEQGRKKKRKKGLKFAGGTCAERKGWPRRYLKKRTDTFSTLNRGEGEGSGRKRKNSCTAEKKKGGKRSHGPAARRAAKKERERVVKRKTCDSFGKKGEKVKPKPSIPSRALHAMGKKKKKEGHPDESFFAAKM